MTTPFWFHLSGTTQHFQVELPRDYYDWVTKVPRCRETLADLKYKCANATDVYFYDGNAYPSEAGYAYLNFECPSEHAEATKQAVLQVLIESRSLMVATQEIPPVKP